MIYSFIKYGGICTQASGIKNYRKYMNSNNILNSNMNLVTSTFELDTGNTR